MKKFVCVVFSSVFLVFVTSSAKAVPFLFDWAFNDNGNVYSSEFDLPGSLPGNIDTSGFDWESGLGTISIAYGGAGDYSFTSFFDHEVVLGVNTFYNEYGEAIGSPGQGQSWDIGDPYISDIFFNVETGNLTNTNATFPGWNNDISMAMGWNFSLLDAETASITLTLSDVVPDDFYLAHHDSEESFFFSGFLTIDTDVAPVPEPATALLFGVGLAGAAVFRKSRKHTLKT